MCTGTDCQTHDFPLAPSSKLWCIQCLIQYLISLATVFLGQTVKDLNLLMSFVYVIIVFLFFPIIDVSARITVTINRVVVSSLK